MDYKKLLYEKYYKTRYSKTNKLDDETYHKTACKLVSAFKVILPSDKNVKILDCACGVGYLVYGLKQAGYIKAEGVDISADQIVEAEKHGLAVIAGDAIAYLDGRTGEYDVIIASDLLEHFTKTELVQFLRVAHKALKDQAILIIKTPNADSPFGCGSRYRDLTHELGLTKDSIEQVLELTGFSDIKTIGYKGAYSVLNGLRRSVNIPFKLFWRMFMLSEIGIGKRALNVPLELNILVTAKK